MATRKASAEEAATIVAAYQKHQSLGMISSLFGRSVATVKQLLDAAGVPYDVSKKKQQAVMRDRIHGQVAYAQGMRRQRKGEVK